MHVYLRIHMCTPRASLYYENPNEEESVVIALAVPPCTRLPIQRISQTEKAMVQNVSRTKTQEQQLEEYTDDT